MWFDDLEIFLLWTSSIFTELIKKNIVGVMKFEAKLKA